MRGRTSPQRKEEGPRRYGPDVTRLRPSLPLPAAAPCPLRPGNEASSDSRTPALLGIVISVRGSQRSASRDLGSVGSRSGPYWRPQRWHLFSLA
jgi:hypothetical protein